MAPKAPSRIDHSPRPGAKSNRAPKIAEEPIATGQTTSLRKRAIKCHGCTNLRVHRGRPDSYARTVAAFISS
jgi:hypothetical protein